ncbi:transcriptional regulator [Ignatzschineria indica]|uniref:LysR substrate-binding domain-containing protein n=2 Tax=Ignatzschineria indica TaxID=472583 RepID=UPI0019A352EE|nr:LysR substrate-binding domain-containing protein [Ignatzschineria indica]GGZ82967.1 transcriptional regulator [Ignatzschineria indica]
MSFQRISRKKIPSIAALQCFEASARHLSFTRAGEELYLSQSAVSKQVAQLEITLQTNLFHRVRKRLRLSAAGKIYLSEARKILDAVEASTLHMLSFESDREILTLAAHPTFGERWLIPAMKEFHDLYPHIRFNLKDYVQPFDLSKDNVDIAFLFGNGVWEGLTTIKLFDEQMIPVCHPSLLGQQKSAFDSVEDFQNYTLLQCQSRSTSWYLYFDSQSVDIEQCYHGLGFETWSACIRAAEMGYGIALVPKFLVEEELSRKTLMIPWDYELVRHGAYYLAYETQFSDLQVIKKLVAWIKKYLSKITLESEKKE